MSRRDEPSGNEPSLLAQRVAKLEEAVAWIKSEFGRIDERFEDVSRRIDGLDVKIVRVQSLMWKILATVLLSAAATIIVSVILKVLA